ncbi:Metallo-dependent phosphatase-like protein [Scheffersomyces xylosifermentans]|uniref:Metallo-dependent phosphatase-like protein n=1 Tax=Scheffersomyces xylosifermentans TaxID=1304137 RepID=UPI00315D0852
MNYRRKDKRSSPGLLDELDDSDKKSNYYLSDDFDTGSKYKRYIKGVLHRVDHRIILVFFLIWVITIHYFERIYARNVVASCNWSNWEDWPENASPHRIALVADPQIVDAYSYPGRPAIIDFLVQKVTDNYLRRNHKFMHSELDPDTTIFLGDLFDGGREWDDNNVWFKEYKRYNTVFPKKVNRRTISSIPGNHDIGYELVKPEIKDRFAEFFGELNEYIELGNHSFVLLDVISLSHPDKAIHTEARNFLSTINDKLNSQFPRILLQHVPMYRFPDTQTCGPLREKGGKFPIQKGKQYQTVLEHAITHEILGIIGPEIIFAGDDHDYCEIQQPYKFQGKDKVAKEIAVKSAAMSSGIKYPAIQLLSLHNPYNLLDDLKGTTPKETFKTEMCYMPNPLHPFRAYGVVLLASIASLVLKYIYPAQYNSILAYILAKTTFDDARFEKNHWAPSKNRLIDVRGFLLNVFLSFVIPFIVLGIYFGSV